MSTPTEDQYSAVPPPPHGDGTGTIPFTGLDALALAVVATGVLLTGIVLRRLVDR